MKVTGAEAAQRAVRGVYGSPLAVSVLACARAMG